MQTFFAMKNMQRTKTQRKTRRNKKGGVMRVHRKNVHGFGGNNDIKTEQLIKTIEEMSVHMIMLNELNCK